MNFSPDQSSSSIATFTSRRPTGASVSRTAPSERSLAWPAALRGHATQAMPCGVIASPSEADSRRSAARVP